MPSSSNSPAVSAAFRIRSTSCCRELVRKEGRPVRVQAAPELASPGRRTAHERPPVSGTRAPRRASPCASPRRPRDRRRRPGKPRTPAPVLEQTRSRRGGHRAHRRRQIDQPPRVDREPAHHLQRGRGVLGANADALLVRSLDDPAAGHVGDVEDVRLAPGGRPLLPPLLRDWRGTAGLAGNRPPLPGRRRAPVLGTAAR